MRRIISLLLALSLAFSVSACGYKGKLKSPEQIAHKSDQKKKEEQKQEEKTPAVLPAPVDSQPVSSPPPVQEQR